jgi:hypothetical protein
MVFFESVLIVLLKVGVIGTVLEKNYCWCEQMVNDLFVLVPHLALQLNPILQPNHRCVEVDPLKVDRLENLKQEELFSLHLVPLSFILTTS